MAGKESTKRSLIPVQVKWDEEGTSVEGVLLSKEMTMYQDNQRGRYLIRAVDGLKVVLGCFQIDQALGMVPEGAYIGIRFLKEEGTGKGNKMKAFDIWVDDGQSVDVETGEVPFESLD